MSNTIYHNVLIEKDSQEVYDAVSQPEHLVKWWPLKCTGSPQIGETYNYNFTDEYNWFAQVTSCKKGDHIHFKMTISDEDWKPTTFGYDLERKEKGTYLRFFHKDWQDCNDHFKHSAFCWALLLKGLKDYLEKGASIPFEKRA